MEMVWIVLIQLVLLHTITVTGCLVNVALNKPASMHPIATKDNRKASTAVDGYATAAGWEGQQIIDTGTGDPAAWWKVDLQREVQDPTVRIYFRTDYTPRRNGVKLYTSTSPFSNSSSSSNSPEGHLCDTVTGNQNGSGIPDVYNTTCSGRLRYLLVYTNISNIDNTGEQSGPTLDFGEVMVLVHNYGTPCTKPCSSRKCVTMATTCEGDGRCPDGCISGWTEEDCTTCDNEHYGPDCNFTCTDRNCLHLSSACDNKTGQCVDGCQAGYNGTDCTQQCDNDHYGPDCRLACTNRKCLDPSAVCDHETGQCVSGCQPGYNRTDCSQKCDSYHYGPSCSLSCSDRNCRDSSSGCDHVTGQCVDGCQAGYNGTDCRQECEEDHYGPDCRMSCTNRQCRGPSAVCDHVTGQCDGGCQPGYNGTDCTQACSSNLTYGANCKGSCIARHCMMSSSTPPDCDTKTGQCPAGCEPAWRGVDCTSQCDNDHYGPDCRLSCTSRKCLGPSAVCDHATGQCEGGCQPGYNGTDCRQECPIGFYGSECSTRCGNCTSRPVCDHVTGNCVGGCRPGWMSDKCNKVCNNGSYGPGCTETCGQCDGVCDSMDGRCPAGCVDGYNGTKCDVSLPAVSPYPTSSVIPAAAGAGVALVVIIIVIVVVVVIRRRRNSPRKANEDLDRSSSLPADVASRRSKSSQGNNVYVNVSMDSIHHKREVKASKPKPNIPPKPSRDLDDDQSEEMLDEDEAPSSTPYYNIDEEEVIREVAVEDLAATVQKIKRREGGFEAEYNRLPTGFTATYADSQKKENTGKNKFIGYYPYDHNRVRLSLLPDVPGSDYINASIMHNTNETKTYIAAQAPKKITLGDFWRMIWEQRVGRVVMLTGLVEDSKMKCYLYWPEKDLLTTDHFRVTLEDTDKRANYTIRTLKIKKIQTGESRRVAQYHYTTWPDHGVPDTLALVNFIWMMRRTHTRTDGPLLVHCSAGIGRTGTYIAVDSLLDQAREEGKVDVQGYVSIMRGQRKNMIQTTDQYECVFNCLVEMTKYGNTSLSVEDFTTLYTNNDMDARIEGKTFIELTQLMLSEHTANVPFKNRMWVDGNQNFIVRTAPSLRSVTGHLLCKSPHPGQEKLLWKLVEENNVNNVIVLDKTQTDLVGEKGRTTTFGNLKLSTTDQTKLTSDLSVSKLLLQEPNNGSKQKIQLFQFNEPVSVESLSALFLENSRFKLMTSELSARVVVHSSTDRKTGVMFCMLGNLMSEIQEDETVDVLHQVRSFTRSFPDIKLTQHDVKQLFNFARRCAQLTASTYANM